LISLGRSFWVVLFLAITCGIAALIPNLGESQLFIRLMYLWIFILVSSWLITILSFQQIFFERKARTYRQQVGQVFEERIEMMNNSLLFLLWVEIRDESNLSDSTTSRILTRLQRKLSRSYQSYTLLTKRGLFSLGPTTILSGDVFGLFTIQRKVTAQASLLVIPSMFEINSFPILHGYLPGGQAIRRHTLQVTPYAAGIREYYPGDGMNRIHWPTSIRCDQLMVKEFDDDPQAAVWIFLDAQKEVQSEINEERPKIKGEFAWLRKPKSGLDLPAATFEYGVTLASSIANYFINQGQEVGLVSSGQVNVVLPAERSERQMGKILENLTLLQPEGESSFLNIVTAQERHLAKGSTVVLITPSTDKSVVLAVNGIIQNGLHPIVVLIDSSSFGGLTGSRDLELLLLNQAIRVILIQNHDDLKERIEQANQDSQPLENQWWREKVIEKI
jgi:uncharacterized protein (DUF58 family)